MFGFTRRTPGAVTERVCSPPIVPHRELLVNMYIPAAARLITMSIELVEVTRGVGSRVLVLDITRPSKRSRRFILPLSGVSKAVLIADPVSGAHARVQ